MPPVVIAAIIGAAVTATEIGLQASGALTPNSPKVSTAPQPLTAQQNAQQTAAVGQQLPNLQSLTGGSLSPEYAAQFGAVNAGVANSPQSTGNIQEAINQFFGLTAPGSTGLTPSAGGASGGPGITSLTGTPAPSPAIPGIGGGGSDIMSLLKGGGGSGIGDWVQKALSGNDFRGLQSSA